MLYSFTNDSRTALCLSSSTACTAEFQYTRWPYSIKPQKVSRHCCNKINSVWNRWHLLYKHNIQVTKGINVHQLLFKAKLVFLQKIAYAVRGNRALRIIHRTLSKTDFLFRKTRNITKYIFGLPTQNTIQGELYLLDAVSKPMH